MKPRFPVMYGKHATSRLEVPRDIAIHVHLIEAKIPSRTDLGIVVEAVVDDLITLAAARIEALGEDLGSEERLGEGDGDKDTAATVWDETKTLHLIEVIRDSSDHHFFGVVVVFLKVSDKVR